MPSSPPVLPKTEGRLSKRNQRFGLFLEAERGLGAPWKISEIPLVAEKWIFYGFTFHAPCWSRELLPDDPTEVPSIPGFWNSGILGFCVAAESRLTPKKQEFHSPFPNVLPGAGIGRAQAVCLKPWHQISSTCSCFKLCLITSLIKTDINVFISFCRGWDYEPGSQPRVLLQIAQQRPRANDILALGL